ncbi:ribonuclease H-like domain-containing protein [Tanacetum coccineum]
MTNSNTPPPPPALTLVEKLYAVHNINSLVPEKLDLQESNYSTWSYFFKGHCSNFNVLNHIDGSTSTSDPPTDEWITADSIVKSWIFLTLSPTLRKRMISTNPASAKAAWDTIETIFQENKRTRTVALKGELRVIQMGDDTPDAVTYAINGLSEKYGSLAQIIAHKDPFPDLATVRTMVTTEEMRLRSKQPILSTSTTSSSPQVLLATSQPRIQDNRNNRDRDALPPTFWVETLHMAAYLLNILPSTAINNEIPHTRLFKTTPNYADLRVFGCLCYPHLHTNHKLEPRATPAIFLGYPTNHRGYRCLDLNTNKIILSRHVTFDETVFLYGSMTPHDSPSYTFLDTSPNIIHQHIISKLTSASPLPTTTITSTAAPPSPPRSPLQPTHQTHESSPLPHSLNVQPTSNASTETTIPTHNHNNPTSTHPMVTRFHVGTNRPTQCFNLHVSTISPIPKSYPIAFRDPNWYRAMLDEYTALIKNNTWILVPRPPDANIVRSMWLFRHKYNADGTLSRYKARLVANGSTQLAGIDVDETFSPVVKPATIRTVLSLAISRHWPVHQLDVKNAFLHGSLSETVYMHQPPGFRDPQHPDHVCLLQRSLYGLKQAPRAWFQRFMAYATRVGFHHSRCDSSLFIYRQEADTAYLLLRPNTSIIKHSDNKI